jgi:hypothetical protein
LIRADWQVKTEASLIPINRDKYRYMQFLHGSYAKASLQTEVVKYHLKGADQQGVRDGDENVCPL